MPITICGLWNVNLMSSPFRNNHGTPGGSGYSNSNVCISAVSGKLMKFVLRSRNCDTIDLFGNSCTQNRSNIEELINCIALGVVRSVRVVFDQLVIAGGKEWKM